MAVVNVDYSEFETLKNRVKELEETVKEKDKTIASLKDGSRVIIRKEVQIEYETFSEPYRRLRALTKTLCIHKMISQDALLRPLSLTLALKMCA